ncbi:hypothetical protein CANTEDRAFT_113782 [Yamadazyma tenuis ATCC 10573]|uniref:Shr3 amino acid permease chaperone n=1 Tax=Candida tenuis (strain ATCC 10573 / BCRC 21748 / CBS 615 / JCM 9827 / NBRC 10315 / NRRL Y-1498 / VKM Y-70) TaxID=590646 RepID=G3B3V5_CANTC|nr:uncharacterized protein CANTEDRAFT_113782 [Yamadazyma tenuis ATCC 10573]EGV64230.1 hypothetical protein CANTEDRAFT_113782 [Yamadazyma tenuis ATCC 10573]
MKLMTYKELLPVGTGLIIFATGFGLGAVYSNLPYDYATLWSSPADSTAAFQASFDHYLRWANVPARVHYMLHFVFVIGLVGCLIKIFKPTEDTKYFEYGTMGMLLLSIVIYLSNLRTGINSCFHNQWGEVPMETGINVIAASQFFIVVLLVGVLVLQGGLYYAEWYDKQLKIEFYEQNPDYKEVNGEAVAITSGADVKKDKKDKKDKKKKKQ